MPSGLAPNPALLPRRRQERHLERSGSPALALKWPILVTSLVVLATATLSWAQSWLLSGCAIESLILVFGHSDGSRVFPALPLWTLLATLNLVYAVCSTSWLLNFLFTVACYPTILLTCLFQFHFVAEATRRALRKMLRGLHFTRDKIAIFNLPALEIDVDVDGLMVIRGLSISLSSLTVVAHGIEVGIKLTADIELALYTDEVRIPLFRRIEIGDVYGNVKGGDAEMTFASLDDDQADGPDDDSVLIGDTPLLRAATAGSRNQQDRPKLRESLTGVSYMKDTSVQEGFESVTTLTPDDAKAEKEYLELVQKIRTTSAIHQSRAQVLHAGKTGGGLSPDNDKDTRAAICAELHNLPSVPHPPELSIRVTTLKNLSPPHVRRFLHRLPFLLRALLALLSYCHPIKISSVNVAGSGLWLSALLQSQIFKHYPTENVGLRRLKKKIGSWLANANFCMQLVNIDATSQVPISPSYDILAYLHMSGLQAYRTDPENGTLEQVVQLGGADATIALPSYLLPHHEHLLPPVPENKNIDSDEDLQNAEVKDEATMSITAHGSLPACFDQSLLNFVAALVKATKIIEFEKDLKESDQRPDTPYDVDPNMPASPISMAYDSDASSRPPSPTKSLTGSIFPKEGSIFSKEGGTAGLKSFAKTLHRSTKSVKKTVLGGVINDRWVAKAVGKIAAKLEQAQGDVGYSGKIPIPLAPYRPAEALPSKLLP